MRRKAEAAANEPCSRPDWGPGEEISSAGFWSRLQRRLLRPAAEKTKERQVFDWTHPKEIYLDEVGFPTEQAVIQQDPSKAVGSAKIMRVLVDFFEIVEKVEWAVTCRSFWRPALPAIFKRTLPAVAGCWK